MHINPLGFHFLKENKIKTNRNVNSVRDDETPKNIPTENVVYPKANVPGEADKTEENLSFDKKI